MDVAIMMARVLANIDFFEFAGTISSICNNESIVEAGARRIFHDLLKNPRQKFLEFFKYIDRDEFADTIANNEDLIVEIARIKNRYLDIFCGQAVA